MIEHKRADNDSDLFVDHHDMARINREGDQNKYYASGDTFGFSVYAVLLPELGSITLLRQPTRGQGSRMQCRALSMRKGISSVRSIHGSKISITNS